MQNFFLTERKSKNDYPNEIQKNEIDKTQSLKK